MCRFYKGEKRCPKDISFVGWECEEMYVKEKLAGNEDSFMEDVNLFCKLGLDKIPELKDGTPIEIQATMFERFCHNSDTDPVILANYFPQFYAREVNKSDELDSDIICLKLWKGDRVPQNEWERKQKEEFDEMKKQGEVPDISWFE